MNFHAEESPDPKLALLKLKAAAAGRRVAKQEYYQAIEDCIAAGVSNTKMATTVGVSETAIRLFRKRKGL